MKPIMDFRVTVHTNKANIYIRVISGRDPAVKHQVVDLEGRKVTYDMLYGPIAETFCDALLAKIDKLKQQERS